MATYKAPWSLTTTRSFNFQEKSILISPLVYSAITDRYYLSITVNGRVFSGIALISGVDLLGRFSTGLPPLYAFNTVVPLADPNPDNLELVFQEVL